MQQRPDVDDVRVGVASLGDRLIKPVPELLALLRRVDVLVVLQVVADDEVGPPLLVAASTDFLAGADCLDFDPVGGQNDRRFPDLPLQLPEVLPESCVFLELGLDVRQEALGLFGAVGEDDLIVLVGIDRRVDGVLESKGRALGVATGGFNRPPAAVRPADLLRGDGWVKPLQDALPPDAVELAVERGGFSDEVVREVGPPKILQVDRPELPAQSLRPGQLLPGLEVPEELRPTLGEIAVADNIFKKKLLLVIAVGDRFTIFRFLQTLQIFDQFNLRHRSTPSPGPVPEHRAAHPPAPGAA